MAFAFLGLTLISLFCTMKIMTNQCQRFPEKKCFMGSQVTVFESKHTFLKKNLLNPTTLMYCKVYTIYLVQIKEMTQKIHLWQEQLKPRI